MNRIEKIKTPVTQLIDETSNVINEDTSFSRTSDAITRYDVCIKNTALSFFERWHSDLPMLISHILFDCDLKSLLVLRLVSKGFYHLASIVNTSCGYSPLSEKVSISFFHNQLHPVLDLSIRDKFEFAEKENSEINVTISVDHLLNGSVKYNSIGAHKIKVILKVQNFHEVKQLQESLSNSPNINFFDKIQGLDLHTLKIESDTADIISELLTAISQKLDCFSGLQKLEIGEINCGSTFNFLSSFSVQKFSIRFIRGQVSLSLPKSINDLTIYYVEYGSIVALPYKIPSLRTLYIRAIELDAIVKLPKILNKLETLNIGSVASGSILQFPNELTNLKTLTIESIAKTAIIQFPISLDSLETLILNDIQCDATLELPKSLHNLKILTIGGIGTNGTLKLPTTLDSLISLTITGMGFNTTFKLPDSFPNLKNFNVAGNNIPKHAFKDVIDTINGKNKYLPDLCALQ